MTVNHPVAGSIPASGANQVGDWRNWERSSFASFSQEFESPILHHSGLLVKWDNSAMAWQHREFDSPTVHHLYLRSSSGSEYHATNVRVAGSNPAGDANQLGSRLMVGHVTLTHRVLVRSQPPQPYYGVLSVVACTSRCDRDSMSSILIEHPTLALVAELVYAPR